MYRTTAAALLIASATAAVDAYEFRVRFVERVGSIDVELIGGNSIPGSAGEERRVRIQFGVFDDADGPAPEGGYFGWNVGTITVNGGAGNSDEFRNSSSGQHNGVGRLSPFNFAPASGGANGLPAQDPFEALTGIDNTLGQQVQTWDFGQPQPQPQVRGRNTWVSTFEFSIRPNAGALDYSIDFGGNLLAALEWRVGEALPPIDENTPGSVTYMPITDAPRAFTTTFIVFGVPSPGAGMVFVFAAASLSRRRRGI